MIYILSILSVIAVVHVFKVVDIFNIHSLMLEKATNLPITLSKFVVTLLNCKFCLSFWTGLACGLIFTAQIFMSLIFGLACYGTVVIISSISDDFLE